MDALFSTASHEGKWQGDDQKSEEGKDKWRVKMEEQGRTGEDESPPSINLGLGIGGPTTSCSTSSSFDHQQNNRSGVSGRAVKVKVKMEVYGDDQVVEEREKMGNRECSVVCFTQEQLEELRNQILIFKYMISGLAIPPQLLLPIWRGFSSLFAPPYCGLYRRTPFSLGFFCLGFDRYMMDPEPGRCRRTDGKKWRCHKSVVPNEKYCENHMHRGRKRSRKLVEASTCASSQNSGTLNPMNTNCNSNHNNDLKTNFPANIDLKSQLPTYKNPMNNCSSVRGNIEGNAAPTRVVTRSPSLNNYTVMIDDNDDQKDAGKQNKFVKERINVINLSSGLDFSPKGVLQGGHRSLKVNLENDPNSEESVRCRRTDGKKWRCSNQVVRDQKYCAHHMNRGSKKPAVALSASGEAKAAYGSGTGAKFNGPEWVKMGLGLHTNLNFSLTTSSANPPHNIEDDCVSGSGGSGSTTETTITDYST